MTIRSLRRAVALACACALVSLTDARSFAQPSAFAAAPAASQGGAIFTVPARAWADINGLVFLIAFDVDGAPGAVNVEYARRFRSLSAHPRLLASARQWGNETYPLLQRTGEELSGSELRAAFTELSDSARRARAGDPAAADEALRAATSLRDRLAPWNDSAARGARQVDELESAVVSAAQDYARRGFTSSEWVSFGPPLADVQSALGSVRRQWHALVSDLSDLKRLLGSRDDVDLETALDTWSDVSAAASAFAVHMPLQARILRGEHYYDYCSVKEGSSYALINDFVDERGMALAFSAGELRMASRPPRTTPAFAWRFRKQGRGWWKLTNLAAGSASTLGVATKGDHLIARVEPLANVSGQLWRCLPSRGRNRLVNAFQGELRSLDTYRDTLQGFMAKTENRSGQYWRFVELLP